MNFARLDYFTGTSAIDRIRALRGTGLNTVLVNWPNTTPYAYGWNGRDEYDYRPMDLAIEAMLSEQSDLRFILSFGALHGTPYYWALDHREELAHVNLRRPMQQASLASRRWLTDSCEAAVRFAAHFAEGPFGDRVVGFFPYQTAIDWHGVGETRTNIPTSEVPRDIDHPAEGDYSVPMQAGFRAYLSNKYGSDAALQDAWRCTSVTLETAALPTRTEVRSPTPNVRDYFTCYNQLNARQAVAWCEALKQGAPDKRVLLPHGHVYAWPAENIHPQGCGHNAPELLLDSEAIDALVAPATQPRDQRCPLPRHAVASLHLHGKQPVQSLDLLSLTTISEADQCAEITLAFGYAAATGSDVAVAEERHGRGSLRDSGEVYNTLPYDSDAIRSHLGRLLAWKDALPPTSLDDSCSEVAVFVSPRACYRRSLETAYGRERVDAIRNRILPRIGLPFDEFLLDDFEAVADRYAAWIFLDCPDLDGSAWERVKASPGRACYPDRAEFLAAHSATRQQPEPNPPVPLPLADQPHQAIEALRRFVADAGAHVWCETGDTLFAGPSAMVFAAHTDGAKVIAVPRGISALTNVLTGQTLRVSNSEVRFTCGQGDVQLYAISK